MEIILSDFFFSLFFRLFFFSHFFFHFFFFHFFLNSNLQSSPPEKKRKKSPTCNAQFASSLQKIDFAPL